MFLTFLSARSEMSLAVALDCIALPFSFASWGGREVRGECKDECEDECECEHESKGKGECEGECKGESECKGGCDECRRDNL